MLNRHSATEETSSLVSASQGGQHAFIRSGITVKKRKAIRVKISMIVNGQPSQQEVEPRLLLVHYLRENLHLTGTHVGCETAFCGACTVLMDGYAVKSCIVLAAQAQGSEITTIEGLRPPADKTGLHPLQEGFQQMHGLQCGYCTPGMILSALDLLKQNPTPSEEEIRTGLGGNLCRCTGYHNIVKAIQYAADKMQAKTPVEKTEETHP